MNIPGHLAVAVATHRLLNMPVQDWRATGLLAVSSLFPDVVDKTIGYILKLMPNGRHFAHNIFALIGSSLLVRVVLGGIAGRVWFAGYLSHLVADGTNRTPWLFPLRRYTFLPGRGLHFEWESLRWELLLLLVTLLLHRVSRG